MAYTPATKFLSTLKFFQWGNVSAPNPTLGAPLLPTDTTIRFSSAPLDHTGAIITGDFLMDVKNSSGYCMTIYVPAGKVSVDGLSATDIVQGVRLEGLDFTTSDSTLIPTGGFNAGDSIGCNISGVIGAMIQGAINGTIASGGTGFTIGTEPGAGGETVTIYRTTTAGVKKGIVRWDTATSKVQYSNDGTTWLANDDVSASVLVKASVADTTPGYLNDKITISNGTKSITNPGANEVVNLDVKGALADMITDVTATKDEINTALYGASANVTSTNLNTLTGGTSTDASALHKHSAQTSTYFAYEAVTTAKAVAQLPIQCEYFTGLTSTELALGNTNANRKRSFAFVPSQNVATVPNLSYRVCEAVNGATAVGDMVVRMETDDGAGKPSGTLVHANATYTITQAAQRTAWTASEATAVITWAGAFGISKGVKYHIVFSASGTDATNYIKLFGNATAGEYENYLVFPQYTYSVDTTVWTAVANSYLYIWAETVPFGNGVVHTDADYSGRTFSFIGIVKTGVSAYEDVEVYENEAPNQTGLIVGQNYYISATAGEITLPQNAGDLYNILLMGVATNSTNIKINTTTLPPAPAQAVLGQPYTTVSSPKYTIIYDNDAITPGIIMSDRSGSLYTKYRLQGLTNFVPYYYQAKTGGGTQAQCVVGAYVLTFIESGSALQVLRGSKNTTGNFAIMTAVGTVSISSGVEITGAYAISAKEVILVTSDAAYYKFYINHTTNEFSSSKTRTAVAGLAGQIFTQDGGETYYTYHNGVITKRNSSLGSVATKTFTETGVIQTVTDSPIKGFGYLISGVRTENTTANYTITIATLIKLP